MINVQFISYGFWSMAYFFDVKRGVAYMVYAHGFTKKQARRRLLKKVKV